MNLQKQGTEANLKDGPRNVELDSFSGGQIQKTGDSANLKGVVGLKDFVGRTSAGELQTVGTSANLNKTPQKGFQGTPMSNRAVKQSR